MFTKNSALLSTSISKIITDSSVNIGSLFNPSFSQLIKNLFANNEQGFAYDPNDLSTMFQDAAGTVPVTGVGQTVGLMLDKSKGLALSSELKQSALAKMTGTAPGATFNTVTGVGTVNRVDVSNQSFIVFNDTVGSKWYKVSVTNNSAVSISLRNATMAAVDSTLVVIQPNTTFNGYVYIALGFLLGIAASTGNCSFTVNSIKEISGNHAYQTVSASRPILQRNATTGAYYLDFDGADDFFVTNSIDFTATNKLSLFTGVQKMPATTVNMLCELSSSSTLGNQTNAFYLAVPELSSGRVFFRSRGIGEGYAQIAMADSDTIARNCVITAKSDIPNDVNTLSIDRVKGTSSVGDLGVGNLGNYPLYIGRRGGTSFPFKGHLYSLIGIGRLTTDAETAALEKLIAKNTGVTLSV